MSRASDLIELNDTLKLTLEINGKVLINEIKGKTVSVGSFTTLLKEVAENIGDRACLRLIDHCDISKPSYEEGRIGCDGFCPHCDARLTFFFADSMYPQVDTQRYNLEDDLFVCDGCEKEIKRCDWIWRKK